MRKRGSKRREIKEAFFDRTQNEIEKDSTSFPAVWKGQTKLVNFGSRAEIHVCLLFFGGRWKRLEEKPEKPSKKDDKFSGSSLPFCKFYSHNEKKLLQGQNIEPINLESLEFTQRKNKLSIFKFKI